MRGFTVVLILICFSLSLQAQFGIKGKYLATSQEWQLSMEGDGLGGPPEIRTVDLFDNGWSVGIDYWFRLKNKRIEFLPELSYSSLSKSLADPLTSEASIYSFNFNTNFYFWDLNGDCDCPTFSKQGPTLSKGLFIQISPGISFWDLQYSGPDLSIVDDQVFAFSVGGGLGFDIGITDLLTVTPTANLRYFPSISHQSDLIFTDVNGNPIASEKQTLSASPLFWSAGLRLGIRLDQ